MEAAVEFHDAAHRLGSERVVLTPKAFEHSNEVARGGDLGAQPSAPTTAPSRSIVTSTAS